MKNSNNNITPTPDEYRYKLVVAYDGTDFAGWQFQPQLRTVQGVLQDSFSRAFNQSVGIVGASRTDAGVHARGQVVRARVPFNIEPHKLLFAWNNSLPPDMSIVSLERAAARFHPQHDIQSKMYQYDFVTQRPSPFFSRYVWHVRDEVDLAKLRDCLQVFVGTHDFRSFVTGDDIADTVRTIDAVGLEKLVEYTKEHVIHRVTIVGPSFLRYMIRRIVGASVTVAADASLTVETLRVALAEKNPHQTLFTAPASGLVLDHITYRNENQ